MYFIVSSCLLSLDMHASGERPVSDERPVVISASVPFYPRLAQGARIEGTVRLQVTTDGSAVTSVTALDGNRFLLPASIENVKSWRFSPSEPTVFVVSFHYKMLQDSECFYDNSFVELRLPDEVHVKAKGVQACDRFVDTPSTSP